MPIKPIRIIKLGKTFAALRNRRGDFEDWILSGLGAPVDDDTVVDVTADGRLPDPDHVGGVVLTGSHDDVRNHATSPEGWSERTARWLPDIVKREIPLLGICYGHQLLAHALGGQVADNPAVSEFGTVEVSLTDTAASDRLFGVLSNPTQFHVTHSQSVVRLPPGAHSLASSERDRHQAFAVGEWAWGVQFHPEFDVDITRTYIEECRQLLPQHDDPHQLMAACVETPDGPTLLRRFAKIVEGRSPP